MDFNDLFSPWMQLHIADLFSQDIDAETQRRIGVTADEFRHKYAVASLEIGISRSLFLSTWQSLKNHDKSLTDRTDEIRNFIAHGLDVVNYGSPPYARLVNARHFSQPWEIGASRGPDGLMYHKSYRHCTDRKKLEGLNKSLNIYNFVSEDYAKWFVKTYAPTQLEGSQLDGLTSTEVFNLQQGLLKEYSNSRS